MILATRTSENQEIEDDQEKAEGNEKQATCSVRKVFRDKLQQFTISSVKFCFPSFRTITSFILTAAYKQFPCQNPNQILSTDLQS